MQSRVMSALCAAGAVADSASATIPTVKSPRQGLQSLVRLRCNVSLRCIGKQRAAMRKENMKVAGLALLIMILVYIAAQALGFIENFPTKTT